MRWGCTVRSRGRRSASNGPVRWWGLARWASCHHRSLNGGSRPSRRGAALAGDYHQYTEGVHVAGISADGASSDLIQVQGGARIEDAALRIEGIGPNAVNTRMHRAAGRWRDRGAWPGAGSYLFLDLQQGVWGDDPTGYRFAVRRNAASFAAVAQTSNQRAVARRAGYRGDRRGALRRHGDGDAAGRPGAALRPLVRRGACRPAGGVEHAVRTGARRHAGPGACHGRGQWRFRVIASQAVVQDDTGQGGMGRSTPARATACPAMAMPPALDGDQFRAVLRRRHAALPGGGRDGVRLGLMAATPTAASSSAIGRQPRRGGLTTAGVYGNAPWAGMATIAPIGPSRCAMARHIPGTAYRPRAIPPARKPRRPLQGRHRWSVHGSGVAVPCWAPSRSNPTPAWPMSIRAACVFDESGNAGLHADAARQQLGYSSLGLRANTGWDLMDGSRLSLHGGAGWRHAWQHRAGGAHALCRGR